MSAHLTIKWLWNMLRRMCEAWLIRIDTAYTHFDDWILRTFHPQGKVGREQALRNELWKGIGIGQRREVITQVILIFECQQCHSRAEQTRTYNEPGRLMRTAIASHTQAEIPVAIPSRTRMSGPLHKARLEHLADGQKGTETEQGGSFVL